MKHRFKLLSILPFLICLFVSPAMASEDFSDRVRFSGFARVVGGYLDEDSATYGNYSNKLNFSEQSLFAVQADVTITDKLGLSGQLLAHSSEGRDSGLEWLYLTYDLNSNWRFKIGRLRTPFFRYSDVIDVGFAYPWITPPQQVYGGFLFTNYEGGSSTYSFSLDELNFDVEAYYGAYNGEISRAGQNIDIEVDEIKGLIGTVNRGNLTARISMTQSSDFYADVPGFNDFADILDAAGFAKNAESLRFNGKATGYQGNINYDTLDYFIAAEWVKIKSDLLTVPQLDAYYLTLGYNFAPFQSYVTFATSNSTYNIPENLIPKNVSPPLTQLSFIYDQITQSLPLYSLDSLSIGLRWDLRYNLSAKTEVTFLRGKENENSFFDDISDANFNRKTTLYQVALEWVF